MLLESSVLQPSFKSRVYPNFAVSVQVLIPGWGDGPFAFGHKFVLAQRWKTVR